MPRSGVRHALFGTLAGRAIVIGVAIRLAVYAIGLALGGVPVFLNVVDTVASIGLAIGAGYFAWTLIVLGKRHLLWRVRRKLILSYVFIGFIPAVLIVGFFLLSGYLLFYNFSSYLVQSRLRAIADQAKFLAQSTAIEIQRSGGRDAEAIITRRQGNADDEYPGLSVAMVPLDRPCAGTSARATSSPAPSRVKLLVAGPWGHVMAPVSVPAWIACDGFSGLLAYSAADGTIGVLLRAVGFAEGERPAFAVIYDVPVGAAVKDRLRGETGVGISTVGVLREANTGAKPLAGVAKNDEPGKNVAPSSTGVLNNLPSPVLYRDWESGNTGTIFMRTELRVGELYNRISSGPRDFGQGLLLALFVIGGLFVLIEVMALFAGLALATSITGSVHELFAGTERVRQGDFTHKIAVKAQDQLGELANSFNSMTASIEDLLREQAEKKRLEEELRIAREIQMSLLPQGPLSIPGLSITATCVPAREVGGDYYDVLPLDGNRLGVLIADVAGKGTSAALYMAELKGLVLSLSEIRQSPRDLLMSANRIIANNLDTRSFITMTYAVIDLRAKTMTYARAGHTPLMYVPGSGNGEPPGAGARTRRDGARPEARQRRDVRPAARGADDSARRGRPVSVLHRRHQRGDERGGRLLRRGAARHILEEHAHLPSEELRERVLREVASFVGDAPQHDDMTMILLKVEGSSTNV